MILREAFDYEFSRLDPHGAHIDPPSVAVYETLILKGPDWQAHPLLAKGWETGADGLEWRVQLRPRLRFHSGAVCDAPAVKRSLEALRREAQPGRDLWYWDPVDEVTADDSLTLTFHLRHPYSRLPALLWGTHTAVYNDELRRMREDFGHNLADGTGPFRLRSWSPERVTVERWDAYPGTPANFLQVDSRRVEQIEWISILDEAERLAALDRGKVDCLHGPPLDQVTALEDDGRFVVIEYPQASNMYLALDWRRTDLGFDDLRVRSAISTRIDRHDLVMRALHGHGTATYGPLPPGDEFYASEVDAAGVHDPARAQALLDQAGFRLGPDGIRERDGHRLVVDCVIQDDPVFRRVASVLCEQLALVGVRLETRAVKPFQQFYEAVAGGPAASISKWLWQDPLDAVIGFSAGYNRPFPNWQHASVPELDDAFQAWLRAGPRKELRSTAAAVQQLFAQTLPYIPLLTPNDIWVHRTNVQGWRPYQANLYPFYHGVWIDTNEAEEDR